MSARHSVAGRRQRLCEKEAPAPHAKHRATVATTKQPSLRKEGPRITKRIISEEPETDSKERAPGKKRVKAKACKDDNEKRLRLFRKHAPKSFLERLERATSQRIFVIDRVRHETDGVPEEVVELAGTTGNVYTITIFLQPKCTCPDNRDKGNQCKHIVFVQTSPRTDRCPADSRFEVLHQILKAPPDLEYQLAFLTTELRDIFARSPLPSSDSSSDDTSGPGKRKPIEGDCPICFMPFEPDDGEDIVWCRAACGNNVHRGCFEQWATSQNGKEVRCVYCRTQWQGDELSVQRIKDIKNKGRINGEGFVNIASALGMSGVRDMSTYHPFWVARQQGY